MGRGIKTNGKINGTILVPGLLLLLVVLMLYTVACSDTLLTDVKVKIERDESSDATLMALAISDGNMFPVFSSSGEDFYVLLTNAVGSIKVTATTNYDSATLTVNGSSVDSGSASGAINLSPGQNTIQIEVTASDGSTTRKYNISVCRAAADLPKTGQTAEYLPGDDGTLEQGFPRPISERFVVDTETITDSLTGLMWVRSPDVANRQWTAAITYVEGLTVDFHNDWRMPNRNELRSIFNYQTEATVTWLTDQGFIGVQNNQYWTSTTCRPNQSVVWAEFMLGSAGGIDLYPKSGSIPVLPVRDSGSIGSVTLPRTGQSVKSVDYDDGYFQAGVVWPTPRFTDNGNGTVTDNLTALMWEQTPSSSASNWTSALTYANNLDLAGFSDWHLPNINELESLFNASVDDLPNWLESEGFESLPDPDGIYWSSTTYAPDSNYAWSLYMDPAISNGEIWFRDKSSTELGVGHFFRAWAVRSGR